LSSITDRPIHHGYDRGERGRQRRRADRNQGGQVLVLFAGALVGLMAVAALVFDVGQNLLDWRSQRNAADAAALAGARYIDEPGCVAAPSLANCPDAVNAALVVARTNGYGDLDANGTSDRGTVSIFIPPQPGHQYAGQAGFIEVDIHTDRAPYFSAVLGILREKVDALAVAGNSDDLPAPYSLLALNEDCDPNPSGQVGGNGVVNVTSDINGEVRVNSDCDGALLINGKGSLTAPECSVSGTADVTSNATLDCTLIEGADSIQDPLYQLDPPPKGSDPPAAVEVLDGDLKDRDGNPATPDQLPLIPPGCPDGLAAGVTEVSTAASPVGCTFNSSETKYAIYLIHPGVYHGGLAFQNKVRVYMAPGVYWIAGGGFKISGVGAQVVSLDRTNTGINPYPTIGKGVLIYNSEEAAFHANCVADPNYGSALVPAIKPCIGAFSANGGSDAGCPSPPPPAPNPAAIKCAWLHLEADDENGVYPGLLFFQDRAAAAQPAMTINGSTGTIDLVGTVYSPLGDVQISGGADDSVAAQVLAYTFKITGSGVFNLTYDGDSFIHLKAAGLVQ
jgi:hypothetical protein